MRNPKQFYSWITACSVHPDDGELVSEDGAIFAKFLPPNVTSLIQPMNHGVFQMFKKRYKKKLLCRLIIMEFLMSGDMKVVAEIVCEAWDEIDQDTF